MAVEVIDGDGGRRVMSPGVLWQIASVVGLLCLVIAYLVNQRGGCRADSPRYLGANVAGAGVLAAYSAVIEEWVFVGLEGFWCVASLFALVSALKTRPAGSQP